MDTSKLCFSCFNEYDGNGPCPHCGFDLAKVKHPFVALPIGTILNGRYLTGRVLGVGGFGVTYVAFDMTLEICVAVKEYLPSGIALRDQDRYTMTVNAPEEQQKFDIGASKFLEEARLLAKLRDVPNIVTVQDYFRENNTAYFVMEYIEGVDLMKYTQMHGGKLSFQEAIQLLLPVIDSLAHVHAHNLLHRDISPDNIVVMKNGSTRLLDFGAARLAVDSDKSKSIILKHGFAPEEQYRKHGNQGPWSDEYALAATMYLILTGEMPPDAIERVHEDTMKSPIELGVEMPQYANDALMKSLAIRASERFPDMSSFSAAITGQSVKKAEPVPYATSVIRREGEENVMVQGSTVQMDQTDSQQSEQQQNLITPSSLGTPVEEKENEQAASVVTVPQVVKKSIWKRPITYILAGIVLLAAIAIPTGIYISKNYYWGDPTEPKKTTSKHTKPTATDVISDPSISDVDGKLKYSDNTRGFSVLAPSNYDFQNQNGTYVFTSEDKKCEANISLISSMNGMRVESLNDFAAQGDEIITYYLEQELGYSNLQFISDTFTATSYPSHYILQYAVFAEKNDEKFELIICAIESLEHHGVFFNCGVLNLGSDYSSYDSDKWTEVSGILTSLKEKTDRESSYGWYYSTDIKSFSFTYCKDDVQSLDVTQFVGDLTGLDVKLQKVKDEHSKLTIVDIGERDSMTSAILDLDQVLGSTYNVDSYQAVTPLARRTVETSVRDYEVTTLSDGTPVKCTTCIMDMNGRYFAVIASCGCDEDLEQVTLDFTMIVKSFESLYY